MKKISVKMAGAFTALILGLSGCGTTEEVSEETKMVDIPYYDYQMLNTEVTQKLYTSIMGSNPSYYKGDNNPVESVSWYDAIYFCNKLSEKLGFTPVYAVDGETDVITWNYTPHNYESISGTITQNANANGFRLPTGEEWKYAAKGGQNYKYSGSNYIDEVAWYEDNSGGKTHPVAQKEANGYGLYDMSGNVREWCWDVTQYDSNVRHYCGGSWDNSAHYCEVDYWVDSSARFRYYDLGFRIVRTKKVSEETKMVDIPDYDYQMLNTEVTQKLYTSVMGSNPSYYKGDNNPVESESWYDAIYFCNKLSEKLGFTPVYAVDGETDVTTWNYTPHDRYESISGTITQNANANGFRLPTVEEWEYAAKGGQNYKYSGSNYIDEVAWYEDNSGGKTHPVAQKEANGYGLYDMSGNVWEWCWDVSPYDSNVRYCCGGGWNDNDYSCKVGHRRNYIANNPGERLGFRIVRTIK